MARQPATDVPETRSDGGRQDLRYAQSVDAVAAELGVDPSSGLPSDVANARLEEYGPNRLREAIRRSRWTIFLSQFRSIVILLMAIAAVAAAFLREWPEFIAVLGVIAVNTAIGYVSESRAVRSMESLRRLGRHDVRVRRDDLDARIPAEQLVPGDVVILDGGDMIPADLRLVVSNALKADESPLTGESVPVDKTTDPVDAESPLAERTCMLYKGTLVTNGTGEAIVVATGMSTELGRIAQLADEAPKEPTPLERQLDALGKRMAWIVIGLAIVTAGAGLVGGQEPREMIETAIALGVAAIPEGMPIVATIALARGMWVMARQNALVNRLAAVETLGATAVILTDKTGTLTENRMTLARIATAEGEIQFAADVESDVTEHDDRSARNSALVRRLLRAAVLCNNANLVDASGLAASAEEPPRRREPATDAHGDPTEIALLFGAKAIGLSPRELRRRHPEVREVPFDSDVMMMATFHGLDERSTGDSALVAVKGAPVRVVQVCTAVAVGETDAQPLDEAGREWWSERARDMAGNGLRVLGIAEKFTGDRDAEPYEELCLVGLCGLYDPPRGDVRQAIQACRTAGIKVVMVTGDQPETGRAIAEQVGILQETDGDADGLVRPGRDLEIDPSTIGDDERRRLIAARVFARVSPEQKLRLVELHKQDGDTVAMTGDGVNDAPALKRADIGVAMGLRGTDAAREVSDVILQDDAFPSIVSAVNQGRVIFNNIRKSVMFMLCTNVAEVFAVATAALIGPSLAKWAGLDLPIPLRALQILFLNVVTDTFPAMALGVGPGVPGLMQQPPRPASESILAPRHWRSVVGWAVLIGLCVLMAAFVSRNVLGDDEATAVTASFLTLAFGKLWFVPNLRSRGTTLLENEIVQNPWGWAAAAFCTVLLIAAVYLPGLNDVLQTRPLGLRTWLLVLGLSVVPVVVGQTMRAFQQGPKQI